MRVLWCTKCRKKFPKDADVCAACGTPRANVNLVFAGVSMVLSVAAIVLVSLDWVTDFTSMLLGLLPKLLLLLAFTGLFLHFLVNEQMGRWRYVPLPVCLLNIVVGLANVAILLIRHPLRQWP